MGAKGFASHRDMSGSASTEGVWLQEIVLVLVTTTPPHAAVPVTVRVAVKDPLGTEGVKRASAGLLFCVHVPRASPPDHITEDAVPPYDAPVMDIGASGVDEHLTIAGPAFAVGIPSMVNRALFDLKAQPP